ncbi:MAG: 4Fe-4S dicluster domain-containing protein [Anaerolineae bacterium]
MTKAMLIDTSMCLGCNACTVACKQNNGVPVGEGIAWTKIEEHEVGIYPNIFKYFIKNACKHCTEASCMNVCPTGAIRKPDGVHVLIDQSWCIGCGYCAMACPFHIPHFAEEKGTAQKCIFCFNNLVEGQTACANACPFGAITYGERDELIGLGKERVSALKARGKDNAYLYGENELGGLHVLYVLEEKPGVYGLPDSPQVATKNLIANWLSGILTAGVIAALPFWLLFRRREALAAEEAPVESEK